MLRWIMGATLRDEKRNDEIRKELEVCFITSKARENRLRWFGHLHRADYGKPAKGTVACLLWQMANEAREDQERDGWITSRETCRN